MASRRDAARAEAAFLSGKAGVDGGATNEKVEATEQEKAQEQFLRGKAYLGREFLTWLLWKSESGDPICEYDGAPVVPYFLGKIGLKGISGDVVELTARGMNAPYSKTVKEALALGLLPSSARLRLTVGDQPYEVSLDAEYLDRKSAKLPDLLAEEPDDQRNERLDRAHALSRIVDAVARAFLAVRASRRWPQAVVELRDWMVES